MKALFVYENISFERGKDPRKKMNIGDEGYRILKKLREIADSLGIEEVGVNDLNPNVAITSWKMPWLVGPVDKSGFGRIILFKPLKEDVFKVFSKGHRGSDIDQWQRWDSPRKWIENIKMLRESVNFERGGTDSQIRKRILGDPPGKIMREGGRTTFSVLMLLDTGKYKEIGFFMRSPGSHKSGGGLKTFYFLPGDEWEWGEEHLSPLSKWEQNKIRKFFPKIEKAFEISPYFGEKINESISFERGKDPRETMRIGSKELLKDDRLGDLTGWTLEEKKRPSQLLGLDPNDVYILGFAGEIDYSEWHFNDFTGMLYDSCIKGKLLEKKIYRDNSYSLYSTKFGEIVKAELDEEGMYFYGGIEAALNIGIPDIPQPERESIF